MPHVTSLTSSDETLPHPCCFYNREISISSLNKSQLGQNHPRLPRGFSRRSEEGIFSALAIASSTSTVGFRLTQVAAYRQTICKVKASDYLLRRINGVEEPVVARAREARSAMIAVAAEMIAGLHWADFETLVDLIFARSGWQRVSRVGENLTDVDLILEQPATGETAFVQVKSRAGQAVLNDYVDRFRRSGKHDHMFFVCHSPKGPLNVDDGEKLHIWAGDRLADAAVRAGLFDWLMERSA